MLYGHSDAQTLAQAMKMSVGSLDPVLIPALCCACAQALGVLYFVRTVG